jgi:hypothetical protein
MTVTGNQVAILQALGPRVFGKKCNYHDGSISHWLTGMRGLEREGLVEHFHALGANGYTDPDRTGHFLTERGRFILRVIEEDLEKFLQEKVPKKKSRPKAA